MIPAHKKADKRSFIIRVCVTVLMVAVTAFILVTFFCPGRQRYQPCTVTVYDQNGNYLGERDYNKYGDVTRITQSDLHVEYQYDFKGRMTAKEIYQNNDHEDSYTFTYRDHEMTGDTFDGKDLRSWSYKAHLNEKGLITDSEEISVYDSDQVHCTIKNIYDNYGFLLQRTIHSEDADIITTWKYIYRNNRPAEAEVVDKISNGGEGSITTKECWKYEYR